MKKTYTVTFFTCAVVIAVVLAAVLSFHKSESKTLKVGFIYVGDASTSYTNNFIEVQNAIADKYGKQVKTIAMCNVAEGTEEEYLERLIDSGCELIIATSYNYGVTMKKLAEKYPDIEFCMATCSNANEEPRLENYHTFMGAIYQGRYTAGVAAGMKLQELIDNGTIQESSEMPTFFVVTNTERIDGAGVIFYPEFMDNMGELLGNDFFILPSSIHQMLILPDDGQVDAEMLRDMVKEVNATQVAPAERLTNDVYHFDTKDHVFEKADRFTERQKEKEAQVAKTEKVGKEQPDQKPKTKKHDMEL